MKLYGFHKKKIYELTEGIVIYKSKYNIFKLISPEIYVTYDKLLFKKDNLLIQGVIELLYYDYRYIVYLQDCNLYLYNIEFDNYIRIYNSFVNCATIFKDNVFFHRDEKIKKYNITEKKISDVLDINIKYDDIFFDENYVVLIKKNKSESIIFNLLNEKEFINFPKNISKLIIGKYYVTKIDGTKFLYSIKDDSVIMQFSGRFIKGNLEKILYYYDFRLTKLFLIKNNFIFEEIPFKRKIVDDHLYVNIIVNPIIIN